MKNISNCMFFVRWKRTENCKYGIFSSSNMLTAYDLEGSLNALRCDNLKASIKQHPSKNHASHSVLFFFPSSQETTACCAAIQELQMRFFIAG